MATIPDLCQIPAGPVPPGHSSNFVDPPSLGPVQVGIMSFMIAWAAIFMVARLCVNFRKLRVSDYFSLIAFAMSTALLGIFSSQTKTARHIWDVPACAFDQTYAMVIYLTAVLFNLGSLFAKASIFLLFFQIFSVQRHMRFAIQFGLVWLLLLYGIGVVIASVYETPRPGESWVEALESGRSVIPLPWWQVQSALSILVDFYIFVLPLRSVYMLNMPLRKRVSVIAVFSLALLGIGASIASLYERIHITRATDVTWILALLSLCSAVELNVAIIVSCAPAAAHCGWQVRAGLPPIPLKFYSFLTGSKGTPSLMSEDSYKPKEGVSELKAGGITVEKDLTVKSELIYSSLHAIERDSNRVSGTC